MATQQLIVAIPPGMHAGQQIQFPDPSGTMFRAVIPPGKAAGDTFVVQVAAPQAAPTQVPMGLPVDAPSAAEEQPVSVAVRHAECPICFEPLHRAPIGVFVNTAGRRVSAHFFNLDAARTWLREGNGSCPLTRQAVSAVKPVPDLRSDPNGWFDAVDLDSDGRLSRKEVIECLKAQLPVNNTALDEAAANPGHRMWRQWDSDGSGYIERNELLQPQGLAAYVRTAFHRSSRDLVPDISRDKNAWYAFWDEDDSGSLEKEEVVRALIKTLGLADNHGQVMMMRGTIDAIWPIFDDDGSGSIERDEFLRPGEGLADTIIATVQCE